jgi:hypothetical protein
MCICLAALQLTTCTFVFHILQSCDLSALGFALPPATAQHRSLLLQPSHQQQPYHTHLLLTSHGGSNGGSIGGSNSNGGRGDNDGDANSDWTPLAVAGMFASRDDDYLDEYPDLLAESKAFVNDFLDGLFGNYTPHKPKPRTNWAVHDLQTLALGYAVGKYH